MKKPSGKGDDIREEPLTAVLLADSFSTKMRPVTSEKPKVLLPLVNSCMIEYTLEWLAASGVEIVYVLCCSHAEQIKAYLSRPGKWAQGSMAIKFVTSYNCVSVGEALRLVDNKGIIKDDFVLVSGDTVTNMNLRKALDAHKARRAADKNAIMTLAMNTQVDASQRLRLGINDLAVAIDGNTKKLLSYINYEDGVASTDKIDVDTTFFSERDAVTLRYDLHDPEVYICAPEVLLLFSDNFDYQHMRRDFIAGVLSEEELGNKLYVHELQNEYAVRVHNFRTYAAVSADVLMRWTYPLCPDSNLLVPADAASRSDSDYGFARNYIYKEPDVALARTVSLGQCTCIGSGTKVAGGTAITDSIIGRACKIGANVTIERCFIMGNVEIADGATLCDAFVCDGAVIGRNARLLTGCLVSYRCVIGEGHSVPAHMRITLCTPDSDDMSEDSSVKAEAQLRHTTSLLQESEDEGAEEHYGPSAAVLQAAQDAAYGRPIAVEFDTHAVGAAGAGYDFHAQQGATQSDLLHDVLTSVALPPRNVAAARTQILVSHTQPGDSESEEGGDALQDPEDIFKREVQETLLRAMHLAATTGVRSQEMQENAIIELNALKIAEVRTFADCARYVLTTLMNLPMPAAADVPAQFVDLFAAELPDVASKTGQLALLRDCTAHLRSWAPLLQRFLKEEEDQIELLLTLEEYCGSKGPFAGERGRMYVPIFSHILMQLYELEIISEPVFLTWEREKEDDDDDDKDFLRLAQTFLDWLKEADEDSDEDDEDDSEASGDGD